MTPGPPRTPPRDAPLRRPTAMRIEASTCIHCDLCGVLLPAFLSDPERIPVSAAALEAMDACPTGALVWLDDERPNEGRGP